MFYIKWLQKNTYIYLLGLLSGFALIIISCQGDLSSNQFPEWKSDSQTNARPDCDACEILFIGSSYLSYLGNDVIEIFEQFSIAGKKNVYIDRRDIGGWRLEDHSQNEQTIAKINEREWDFIILQGNAAVLSQQKWHDHIIPFLKDLRRIIKSRSQKTCIIYMMAWAYSDGLTWVPGETDTYEEMQINLYNETIKMVHDLDIASAPVGWAWYTAISNGYKADLYLNDFNHQSSSGAYLAACVFYATIFLESAPFITYTWSEFDDAQFLHDIAYATVINHLDLWNIY